ncbi:MAG: hypothetical protein GY820_13135, partial [Gammaproteobacteria bacterium]|nr:hypothetical protein [Gammaproteobacteria bacterium]
MDREFYRLDRGWEASVAPIAVSFLEADKLPDETSRLHLTNINVMRHYLEDMMMKLPQQQVMNKRGQFVLPEDELKYWEEHLREYYVASQIPTMSTMDINVWESQWWIERVDQVVDSGAMTSGRMYETFLKSQLTIGRVPACAALLMHSCERNGGRRYALSDAEFAKLAIIRLAAGEGVKQPLISPSGTPRHRQSPKRPKQKK